MRVVLDTNVLISSTQWPGSAARKVLGQLHEQKAEMFTSAVILEEFKESLRILRC